MRSCASTNTSTSPGAPEHECGEDGYALPTTPAEITEPTVIYDLPDLAYHGHADSLSASLAVHSRAGVPVSCSRRPSRRAPAVRTESRKRQRSPATVEGPDPRYSRASPGRVSQCDPGNARGDVAGPAHECTAAAGWVRGGTRGGGRGECPVRDLGHWVTGAACPPRPTGTAETVKGTTTPGVRESRTGPFPRLEAEAMLPTGDAARRRYIPAEHPREQDAPIASLRT